MARSDYPHRVLWDDAVNNTEAILREADAELDGVITRLLVAEGDMVVVDQEIAEIGPRDRIELKVFR